MKQKLVIFVLGFMVSSLCWYGCGRYIHRPKDWTKNFPVHLRDSTAQSPLAFLKNAYADEFPSLTVFRPAKREQMLAYVQIGPPGAQNILMIWDSELKGVPDSLVLMDGARRSLMTSNNSNNGIWDNWTYSSNPKNGQSYSDMNMDGQPDLFSNLGSASTRVFYKGAWQELHKDSKSNYILIDGRRTDFNLKEFLKQIKEEAP